MKKLRHLSLIAVGLLAVLPAHALTAFTDKFDATSLNTTRWSLVRDDEGNLIQKNGKLNLITPKSPEEPKAYVALKSPKASVTENWEAFATIENKSTTSRLTWICLVVGNAANLDKCATIEIETEDSARFIRGYLPFKGVDDRLGPSKKTSSTKLYVRASYSKSTRIITFSYRSSSTAAWTKLYTYSPFNSSSANYYNNWGMSSSTGKFVVGISGGSDNLASTFGTVTVDDFTIRNY